MQYEAWEWAGRYKEVRNALKGPNYCDYFKNLYEEEINQGKLVLKEPNFMLEWQLFHHCVWDKILWNRLWLKDRQTITID